MSLGSFTIWLIINSFIVWANTSPFCMTYDDLGRHSLDIDINCLTVYSKIHSAAANCVTGAIHTYIFTIHGIEMRGTNK